MANSSATHRPVIGATHRMRYWPVILTAWLFSTGAAGYSGLVVFGDSLSDSGQFPDPERLAQGELGSLRFTNRVGPEYRAPAPYGEVSTQRLADALGLAPLLPSTSVIRDQLGLPDGTNYATGGYTTADIVASITQPDGSVVSQSGLTLRTRDGYLVTTGGSAAPEALYYVNGGGNDFLDGLVTQTADAIDSADTLARGIDALVAAGARTIVVSNLPDVGQSPAGLVSGQREAFSSLVQVYNQALGEHLARYDGKLDIIRLDVPGLFADVTSSPAEFGLATDIPLANVCFSDPLCDTSAYGLASGNPDPSRLLFYDTVHPTTAGQQILADYAYALIRAPQLLSLSGELAVGSLAAQQQAIASELRPGMQGRGLRLFVQGDHQGGASRGFVAEPQLDASHSAASVGAVMPLARGWVGVAAAQREASLDHPMDSELDGQAFSLFARQQFGRVGVQAIASRGDFDLDLQRRIALGSAVRVLDGTTQADGWAGDLRLDYRLTASDSPWYTAPFIGYRHVEVEIEGYREQGSAANALIVSEQSVTERQAEAGFLVDRAPAGGLGFFAELAGGRYLDGTREGAEVRLASLPTNRWSGEEREREDQGYLRLDAGLRMRLGDFTVQAGGGVQGWSEAATHVQLSAGFSF
ncbi:SGNH/GDSL hydrolase family protein [Halomonas sp. HP20-15]|uniref:autotransporter domain-containing protein n=1 Tax=Halomonas sp. HP20-15 TaxID=3085901 RepID=UPI002981D57D|nr:autotransporter domain-containing protein [Halomonas sp. HP20-15]MDW5378019.1 SGNH/GDSL hydrolase family protein [Halomonas sp. HP20-15]